MKRLLNPHSIVLFFSLLAILPSVFAENGDLVEKKKTISKSYPVTSSDKLNIENSFGNVVVNTWDKNEIKVDIEMAANASSEERAQRMLDGIEVNESRSGKDITFKTNVNDIHDNDHRNKDRNKDNNKENNRTFYIDYTVYMPKVNPLDIQNQFGKITLPDFSGPANIVSKFGGLTAGKLDNVEAIDVEFGTAQIGQVRNGKVTFKFDNNSQIGKVGGNVRINSEFSNHVLFAVENAIEELTLNESYSSVKVVTSTDLSASFDIHTNFGHFHNDTGFKIKEDRDDDDENSGPRFDKDYSGKANSGNARIKIKSSFGSVRLSHTSGRDKDDDEIDEKQERKEHREKREKKEVKEKEEKEEVSL